MLFRSSWLALVAMLFALCPARSAVAAQVPFDFNGDGRSDILWRNTDTGDVYLWEINALMVTNQGYLFQGLPLVWQVVGIGDFNGDGRADILWRDTDTGDVVIWEMNGFTTLAQGVVAPNVSTEWQVGGIADFNGDGKDDILWRNANTGDVYLWEMNGLAIAAQGYLYHGLPRVWQIAGVGDFNGDGKADILWRNTDTGDVVAWEVDGLTVAGQATVAHTVSQVWHVIGIGDFNGDGKADVLWRNTNTGDVYLWEMNGLTIGAQGYIAKGVSLVWQVAEIGDFNGDGRSDVLWRNAGTGDVYCWEINGFSIAVQGYDAKGVALDWQIAPAPRKVFGLDFSPFVYPGQDPNLNVQISDTQLTILLANLAPYTQWIRTFGLTLGQQDIAAIARSMGLKTAIGAFLDGNSANDSAQIATLIQEAQAGNVDVAVVGNENLRDGSLTVSQVIAYLKQVKAAVPANVLVTHVDTWAEVVAHPDLLPYEDIVCANIYPFYENVSIDNALAQLQSDYQKTVQFASPLPVWITETGWPSSGNPPTPGSPAVPSPQNEATYFSEVEQWVRAANIPLLYFEAYDEPWKVNYNDYPSYGLWDVNLNFKPALTIPFH
jgi:exo-beta-1,3-glucanase (GH17 family)